MLALITGGARSGKSSFAEAYAASLGREGVYIATAQMFDSEMERRTAHHRERREASGFRWRTMEEPYELAELLMKLDAEGEFGAAQGGPEAAGVFATVQDRTADAGTKEAAGESRPVVLVDCLTLWLSNWLFRADAETAALLVPQERDEVDGAELVRPADKTVHGIADDAGRESYRTEKKDAFEVTLTGQAAEDADRFVERKIDELAAAAVNCRLDLLLVTNEVGMGLVPEYPLGRRFRDLAGRMNQRFAAAADQVFLVTAGIPVELKSIAFQLPAE